jgi:hypothetical protein
MMLVGFAARVCVAAVFVVALSGKVRGRAAAEGFAGSLVDLKLVSRRWSTAVAMAVVGVEALTAALLVVPATGRIGAGLAVAVLTGFAGALLVAARRGASGPCPCFGAVRGEETAATRRIDLARNIVLVAVAAAGGLLDSPVDFTDPGIAPAVVLGLVAAALVVRVDDLVMLVRPLDATRR